VRRAWLIAGALAVTGVLAGAVVLVCAGGGSSAVAAGSSQPPTAGDSFTPELGLPATDVVAIGASPQAPGEERGEVWAYGELGAVPASVGGSDYSEQYALLQHTDAAGWQVVPLPPGPNGETLAARGASMPAEYGAFAGQATAAGGVALLSGQNVVVRDPGARPLLAPAPATIAPEAAPKPGEPKREPKPGEAEGVLEPGESLLPSNPPRGVTLPYAAIEDASGHTGLLIAPQDDGGKPAGGPLTPGVLHYDGERWTREPIELSSVYESRLAKGESHFTALALACGGTEGVPASSSPRNCWLLASSQSGASSSLMLFRREPSTEDPSGYEWDRQPVSDSLLGEEPPTAVRPLAQGAQMLTVTAQGAWVDFSAKLTPLGGVGTQQASDVSELVLGGTGAPAGGGSVPALPAASVAGRWCYPTGVGCESSLGEELPVVYRSFAWPGASPSGAGGDLGTRIITGLPDRAMLEFAGGVFSRQVGAGGRAEAPGGAAFDPPVEGGPWEGWIADDAEPASASDGAGQSQVIHVTTQAHRAAHPEEGDQLQEEAVPFRRPLYALAQAPGTTPGAPSAEAVTVGEDGQIGRYASGHGWRAESLYNSAGEAQTPTLRGVAWPEPGRIYAVGDKGEMWLWRAETGLWEPDPAKPLNLIANLTAIAFDPSEPDLGYVVGKQGTLLKFGKTWEQVPLPAELQQANFTSVAFAGGEALATYRVLEPGRDGPPTLAETGGIAVEEVGDGEHWHVDAGASALLEQLSPWSRVLSKVAGLPDGGAIAAGPGKVLERESAGAPWRFSAQPLPEAQNVSALAAYRDSAGAVRALVSVDLDEFLNPERFADILEASPWHVDVPPPPAPNQPPPFLEPDPVPNSGYLLRQTATGWSDMEHAALPALPGELPKDMPVRPDPVLALLASPSGEAGLAVGGQTGDIEGVGVNPKEHPNSAQSQTAAALRFPASAASPAGFSPAPIPTVQGDANFVVAGQATCEHPCADFANEGLGPDVWLTHALQEANGIAAHAPGGLRSFLYTGGRLSLPRGSKPPSEAELARELVRYQELLGGGGSLPVHAADSSDTGAFVPGGGPANYSFISEPPPGSAPSVAGDKVMVIVLDLSKGELGAAQRGWLKTELENAEKFEKIGVPAIVMGNDSLGFKLPQHTSSGYWEVVQDAPADATAVTQILIEGHASAYFFDYPGANVKTTIAYGTRSIPAFGTGTLGYVQPPNTEFEADSLGSSGFLLASVAAPNSAYCKTHGYPASCNVAPVTAKVVPNIGQLALDATDGTYLRRSQVALFEALARRPPGGVAVEGGATNSEPFGPDPYDPIPFDCSGANCPYEVPAEYTFTSSNPDIGGFVMHDPATTNPREVLLGSDKLPVSVEPLLNASGQPIEEDGHYINQNHELLPKEEAGKSGLFCAYNTTYVRNPETGETENKPITVSITTGGLTYSEPVTIQAGSVEYPCGTVPLKDPPALQAPGQFQFSRPEPAPATNPPPVNPHIQLAAPPPPPPPVPVHHLPHHHPRPAPQPPFLPLVAGLALLRPALLPPPPATGQPVPPSGTSSAQVYQSAVAPQRQREEETAIDVVHNMAAYSREQTRPLPYYVPAVIVLLAFSGAVLIDAGRRRRPELAIDGETEADSPI
jgi:hypothetical protein